jgi:hypothetical protein
MLKIVSLILFISPIFVQAEDFIYNGTSGTDIMNCNRNGNSILDGFEGDDYYIVHISNDYECILRSNEFGKRYVSFNINSSDEKNQDNKTTIIKLENFSEKDILDVEELSDTNIKSINSSYEKETDKKILSIPNLISIYSEAKTINMFHKNSLGKIFYGSIGLNDNLSCDGEENITIYSLSNNNIFNRAVPSQNNCTIYNNNDGNNIFKFNKINKDNQSDFSTKLYINNFKPGDILDISELKIVSMDYIKFDTSSESPILQIGDQLTIFFPQIKLSCSSEKVCMPEKDPNYITHSIKL